MGYGVRMRSAAAFYPAVTSRAGQVERARPAPASAVGVFDRITCLSAPRNEKERTHMRIIYLPPPNQLPATFVCTSFAILVNPFIAYVRPLPVRRLFYF